MSEGSSGPRPCIVLTYPFPIGEPAAGGARTIRELGLRGLLAQAPRGV